MVNTRQKQVSQLVFKRGGRGMVPTIPPAPLVVPEPPEEVGEYAIAAWNEFWETPVSGLVNMKRDGEHLRHWCRCVDQRHRLWPLWVGQPLRDVRGELRGNPLFSQLRTLNAEIERSEMLFGMTPLYLMRLTGALDQAEQAESNIMKRQEGRRPKMVKV